MATKKSHHAPAELKPEDAEALEPAAKALVEAAKELRAATAQMMDLMKAITDANKAGSASASTSSAGGAPPSMINTWEDDPFSELTPTTNPKLSTPISVPEPVNPHLLLQTKMLDPTPAAALYPTGTPNFRFWANAEALARGINFWAPLLPTGTRWTTTVPTLNVTLVAGEDLNANYTRVFGLRFFQRTVRNLQVFSGESPDIVCHELGHAILDALKPQLFNAASLEVSSFHESFGDMSAILSGLQLDTMRTKIIQETQGHLNVNSRLSRVAEQLGWAIRQLSPTAVDADCLRNAANRFFYKPPAQLPPVAPSTELSSEFHSFSRIFTGAFLDALARMLTSTGAASAANLKVVTETMGRLLINGVILAPITSGYYSRVAAAMIQADQSLFQGRNRAALSTAFIQHGILSPAAANATTNAPQPSMAAASVNIAASGTNESYVHLTNESDDESYKCNAEDAPDLPITAVTTDFGFDLHVHVPDQQEQFSVASASVAGGGVATSSAADDAMSFIEDLFQLGYVDVEPSQGMIPREVVSIEATSNDRKTHFLESDDQGGLILKRSHFECAFCRRSDNM
jgi:hypothetical protein